MKPRTLVLVGVGLVLCATGLRAQDPPIQERVIRSEEDPWHAVAVSPAKLNLTLPFMITESGGTGTPLDRMAQVGMTKQEYVALKNSLIVARLDALTPARLRTVTGAQLQIRQANVTLYNANETRLEPVVSKLHSDGPCGPCSPGGTVMEIIKR